jgi:membrane-bound lytic murein transglycosylase D
VARLGSPAVAPDPPAVPTEAAVPVEGRPLLDDLYRELEQGRRDYLEGIDRLLAGEEVAGEEQLAEATSRMLQGAEACARLAGCEIGRFLDAFERLMAEQGDTLKAQASRLYWLEQEFDQVRAEVAEVESEPGTSPFVSAMPEAGKTAALLRGTDLSEIIDLNGPVSAALDDWLTWNRPLLMSSWINYQFLRDELAPIFEEAGLPEALLFAMMATETGGKVHAYSRAGAAGPLQFMSRTGRKYGLRVVDGFDLRLDPVSATRAAVRYLDDRFVELDDSLELALAAYNGGESRVQRLHRKYRGAGLWDSRLFYSLPMETRAYVPRILAAAWLFMHPERYQLEFPELNTEKTLLELREPISLGELTICLGQQQHPDGWFRTLRNLNPRLSPGERVPAGEQIRIPQLLAPAYEQRCLGGDVLARAQLLHEANYPPEPQMIPYEVQRNDTLSRIAARHRCVSMQELAAINRIRPPRYVIRVGQRLMIPSCR